MMQLRISLMRSKVASRFFLLFVLCSLFPFAILAVLSFSQVNQLLYEQSRNRLRQTTRAASLTIHERLVFLENEMKLFPRGKASTSANTIQITTHKDSDFLKKRFNGMSLITKAGDGIAIWGAIQTLPNLTPSERNHLLSGQSLIITQPSSTLPANVLMAQALDPEHPDRGILLGEINPDYLWEMESESTLPSMTEFCVLDHVNNVLFSSVPVPAAFTQQLEGALRQSGVGQFEWEKDRQGYLAGYRFIFLQPQFFAPKWTVILSEHKSEILAPIAYFKKIFPFAILLSILVVLLLSIHQIRRNLIPLEKLREATHRVANRDFSSRVSISSGDEFEELADSFNRMAGRLDKQFHALTASAEIDRAILSALNPAKIVSTLLRRVREVFPCDGISMTLADSAEGHLAQTFFTDDDPWGMIQAKPVRLQSEEMQALHDHPDSLFLTQGVVPSYLAPVAQQRNQIQSWLILPIFLKERVAAILGLGYANIPVDFQEDLIQARQLAGQIAVALSNARLLEEFNKLSWGTLTALARTIDAKSPWTAGHSERVTHLGLKIGKALNLSPKQLETLHRGGLLHDTGKIGTPVVILDKSDPLTQEEIRIMREHVKIGARILEPIPAFSEIVPIVLQHHERFDGTGYPYGLTGEEISLEARIFAVADCFDAMASDRPYRPAMDRKTVIEAIQQEAGCHFDPKVVRAFQEVMEQEEREGRKADER
jgi:putative nucleotidyltransferase with HDIG domain